MSISFRNVSKSFADHLVLNEVSFDVEPGEVLFIIGKSGVGKSVTLKLLVGMLDFQKGEIEIEKYSLSRAEPKDWSEIRKICGLVFQQPALFDSLTIYENLAFGLRRSEKSEASIRRKVLEALPLVDLSEGILKKHPTEVAFGMRKRISLLRTLLPGPKYLLFDEPTTGLDPVLTRTIHELIQNLSTQLNITCVVVSHDMEGALEFASRILVLDQGKVLEVGKPTEIKASRKPLIREFLKEVVQHG